MVEAPTTATAAPFFLRPNNPLIPAAAVTVPGYQRNLVTLSAGGGDYSNQESSKR
jgi:hypothetical protein